MPLDIIKIDKCFIEHLGEDDFSDAFVKMVTELANTIGAVSYTHLDVYKRQP